MTISLFGWLENIPFWRDLPYPTKGALLRAFKAALSVAVGILVAALAQGILLPPETSPWIALVVAALLQGLDKYLREAEIAKEADANPGPLTDNPTP
jgi:hypothetical protein